MNKDRLEELIYKFQHKKLTSSEKEEFETLLKSYEEAREIFHNWNTIKQYVETISINKNIPEIHIPKSKLSFNRIQYWIRNFAAILTIPLIIGFTYLYIGKESSSATYNEVTATNAKVVRVNLSDGSTVFLYSGSTLKYPNQFSEKERLVELTGEATFEVKSNPQNPFYVITSTNARVKAYGTKFSVKDYAEFNALSVYLERGIVDFENKHLKNTITLRPDTKLIFDKTTKKYTIHHTTPNEYDGYEQGILVFNKKSLEEVVEKLRKVYQTDIIIQDESLKEYLFTATFKDETIDQIMDMLKTSSPQLQWQRKNSKIILYKKNN